MTYIIKRFGERLACFDAWQAATADTDKVDKSVKFVEGIVKPLFELMSTSGGFVGKVGQTALALPFFQFLVTIGKNLMAPAVVGKAPIWWIREFKPGLTWEKFFSTIGNPFLQLGNLMDTLMFLEMIGVATYGRLAEQVGKIPVFGAALKSLGLKGVKAYSVMISSALSVVGVGVFLAHRTFVRDRNQKPDRSKIEAENEKQFANFFNGTSKGLVVWMVYRIGNKNPFPFIGLGLFVAGVILGLTNLWKYVMAYQDADKKALAQLAPKGRKDMDYFNIAQLRIEQPDRVSQDKRVLAEAVFSKGA
jgi:hypothetical protein